MKFLNTNFLLHPVTIFPLVPNFLNILYSNAFNLCFTPPRPDEANLRSKYHTN